MTGFKEIQFRVHFIDGHGARQAQTVWAASPERAADVVRRTMVQKYGMATPITKIKVLRE